MTHSPLVLAALGHRVDPTREAEVEIKQQLGHQGQSESRLERAVDTYPWTRGAGGARQPHATLGTRQTLQWEQPR